MSRQPRPRGVRYHGNLSMRKDSLNRYEQALSIRPLADQAVSGKTDLP